ncbi:hypothetical protein [Pedobacter nutrimenti]|jgi:hypothetical protein|uniref:Uncharacterized protein n=1 Tax=Pedobacter nutrimenti TaxID=1241337 RepID=A0A318UQM6_9SPHI|nr:hypothetical protein [Pedobacter nutrimenti]PYF73859.1 hypothetical protein B0O44_10429 [Pedobacter nutrimenti]
MKISELAKSFYAVKTSFCEQEKDLLLTEKLVNDLLKDPQTPDLELEISGLKKNIKIQQELLGSKKTELDIVSRELLGQMHSEGFKPEQKTEVHLTESSYVEIWPTKKETLACSTPIKRN